MLLAGYIATLCGCVHVTITRPDGSRLRASATGNGTIVVAPDGTISAVAVDTADTYKAAGDLIGTAAGAAARKTATGF